MLLGPQSAEHGVVSTRACEQEAKVIAYWPAGKGGLATDSVCKRQLSRYPNEAELLRKRDLGRDASEIQTKLSHYASEIWVATQARFGSRRKRQLSRYAINRSSILEP